MFDGIVEEVGCASAISMYHGHLRLTIAAEEIPPKLAENSLVAINGMCLKAVDVDPESFSVELPCETWLRTSFARIREGSLLNLERAHDAVHSETQVMLRGRIDGVGNFQRLQLNPATRATSLYMMVRRSLCGDLMPNAVLGVEGISFAVEEIKDDLLCLRCVYSLENTSIAHLSINDTLNIECIRALTSRRERKRANVKSVPEREPEGRGCARP